MVDQPQTAFPETTVNIEVTLANSEMVQFIADNLRPADRRESASLTSAHPREALKTSHELSKLTYCIKVDGKPTVVFGVADIPGTPHGSPWLMATPDIEKIKVFFIRNSRKYLTLLRKAGPYFRMRNMVDMRNELHVKWLKFLGAKIQDEPIKQHFRYFEI